MKTRYLIIFLILCLMPHKVVSQSFFEDAEGKSSLTLPVGGLIRINTSDESLKLGYFKERSDKKLIIGFDVSGKSSNGIAPLFNKGKISPEAALNLNLGIKHLLTSRDTKSNYDYLSFKGGIKAANYKMIDTTLAFDNQVSTVDFTGLNLGIGYNYVLNGNMIFGLYLGYDHTSNISDLDELKVVETNALVTNPGGNIARTVQEEFSAWAGTFEERNMFSFYADYIYIPNFLENRLALSVYLRSYSGKDNKKTNAGIGMYLNQEGEPTKVIGGIIYQFDDLADKAGTGTSLGKRGRLALVAGYNF